VRSPRVYDSSSTPTRCVFIAPRGDKTGNRCLCPTRQSQAPRRRAYFGYPGGAILPIYDELYRAEAAGGIQHILVRHEQGAAHAADGLYPCHWQGGCLLLLLALDQSGNGVATAQMDSIPMVIVTGRVPLAAIGTDAFQETDVYGIAPMSSTRM